MNRRELFQQMRAAELCVLPPTANEIGTLALWARLLRSVARLGMRVGVLVGVVGASVLWIGTGLLDGQLWTVSAHAFMTWLVLAGAHAVAGAAAGVVAAVLVLGWMLVRRQVRHRRHMAVLFAGVIGGAWVIALGCAAWYDVVATMPAEQSMRGGVTLVAVVAIGMWIGRALQVVLGAWSGRELEPPFAPRRNRRGALWRAVVLVGLVLALGLDLQRQHVDRVARTDERVAETLSLRRDRHVILLGIDGLGWDGVRAGIGDGALTNWDTLEQAGARGRLRSTAGHGAPAFWTTVATGARPSGHGVRSVVQPRLLGSHRPLALAAEHVGLWRVYGTVLGTVGLTEAWPVSRYSARRWLAWEVVRHAAGEAGVVGWWGAWPDDGKAGTLALGTLSPGGRAGASPLDTDARVGDALREMLHRSPRPSLTMAYLPGLDLLARAADARTSGEQVDAHRRFLDALIGEVAAALGPDDLLMVVGDAGGRQLDAPAFRAPREADGGIVLAFGSGIAPAMRLERPRAEAVWPTVAWWLGLPPALDWDGQPWVELRPGLAPLPSIPSYGRPARAGVLRPAARALRRRQLRDAGYLP